MDTLLGIVWLILMGLLIKGYWDMVSDEQKNGKRKTNARVYSVKGSRRAIKGLVELSKRV